MNNLFGKMLAILLPLWLLAPASVMGNPPEELDGLLEPNEKVAVSSQVPGILDEILVERGDRVQPGQVLARLKSGVEKAAVALAEARVDFGRRKAVRNEELYKKQLISNHEKDELETEIQLARLELREAEERLNLRTIASPIQGVVVERLHAPGDYVGEDAILTVVGIDPLHVEVVVPVAQFGSIRKGMRAEVKPEAPVGGKYKATVVIVDQVVDAASGTFGVRLKLPNPKHRLPAGLKCAVRFFP
jgi:membrane fusion protein, multidrug efflux system